MVRAIVYKAFGAGMLYAEYAGLSSDAKPAAGIVTGSKYTEVDTGVLYLFDEVTGVWTAQNSGNGKTSVAGATVTLGTALKYTGSQQTQTVSSVKIGSTTLTENTDYQIVGNTGTEMGDYTLTVIGKGSYAGAVNKAWSIGKGEGSVSASPDSLSLTAGGDAGESALTVTGDGAVSVESSAEAVATVSLEGTTVTVTPVVEGSATVTVTLAAGERYSGDTATISVSVAAAEDQQDGEG